MNRIHVLKHSLADKIAAGEVVERPSSVVKELVENSIDANASMITIEIEEAGLKRIRIVDNGHGIYKDDMKLAFNRHATSKLKEDRDLFHIRTLGFRGEALASIASVAEVSISSSVDGIEGYQYEPNQSDEITPSIARQGTDISVSHLFYNTPARLKYIKSLQTEQAKITNIIQRMMLAHPEIAFKLKVDGKVSIQSTGRGSMTEVIKSVYSTQIAKDSLVIDGHTQDYDLTGLIVRPHHFRSSNHYISIFINGRYIKNYKLNKAILEGYKTLLPIGKFPIVVLHLTMDPQIIDVNVHPTKEEVRLSKENELFELIRDTIQQKMQSIQLIPSKVSSKKRNIEDDGLVKKGKNLQNNSQLKQQHKQMDWLRSDQSMTSSSVQSPLSFKNKQKKDDQLNLENNFNKRYELNKNSNEDENTHIKDDLHEYNKNINHENNQSEQFNELEQLKPSNESYQSSDSNESNKSSNSKEANYEYEQTVESNRLPYLEIIGQAHGTYIMMQNDEGLYLMDQHAAQERINYEKYYAQFGQKLIESQLLMIPIKIERTREDVSFVMEHIELFENIGLKFEMFSDTSLILNEWPTMYHKVEPTEAAHAMIDLMIEKEVLTIQDIMEEAAIMMSCKMAIKANEQLNFAQMNALLNALRETSMPYTCPHGRPIIIKWSVSELEKLFNRIQQ